MIFKNNTLYCHVRLKNIANSWSVDDYTTNLQILQTSEEWVTDSALQNWLSSTWIPQHKVSITVSYLHDVDVSDASVVY